MEEQSKLTVEGMTCTNCALGVTRTLEGKGLKNVSTDFASGQVSYTESTELSQNDVIKTIENLGYKVIDTSQQQASKGLSSIEKKMYISAAFAIPLFMHMFLPKVAFLQNSLVQIGLCLPPLIIGLLHFGKSALGSLRAKMPNMDVLIFIGFTSAFGYSLAGTIMHYGTHEAHSYMFFETTATIITLVLLGNVIEHRSVKQTTTAIRELSKIKMVLAKRILGTGEVEEIEYEAINVGDELLVNTGDKIPVDGIVVWGSGTADEAMLTGESLPIEKEVGHQVFGGAILNSGSLKMRAEKVGSDTLISQIIELVNDAQSNKPTIQKLGDKVSAIFVPAVLSIAVLTFTIGWLGFDLTAKTALMNSIAVLVISCPCAMGLATPTAVAVGIGRAAQKGILVKGGNTLELMAELDTIVFDKTGTLTTGEFSISNITSYAELDDSTIKSAVLGLENFSSHPIAKSLVKKLESLNALDFAEVEEISGKGIKGVTTQGDSYFLGSYRILKANDQQKKHSLYLTLNDKLVAGIDIEDEIKPGVKKAIETLNEKGIKTVLLSGDKQEKCDQFASLVGITEVHAEKLPNEKLQIIEKLSETGKTAMVGDGINDAPALAKASIGISMSGGTQVAIQSAQVILLNGKDLSSLIEAITIGKHTLLTIKQNLFWAFFYNVVAIPVAAIGLLNPMVGALTMAFSDVIVIGNSVRFKFKRLKL